MEYYREIKNAHMTIWMNLTNKTREQKVRAKRAYTNGIAQCVNYKNRQKESKLVITSLNCGYLWGGEK